MSTTTKVSVTELTPQLKEATSFARQHEEKLIKIQALARGFLVRKQFGLKRPAKRSSRKQHGHHKTVKDGEVGLKLSSRSGGGRFKGGGMMERQIEGGRGNLVFAKAIQTMPDYSTNATKETEKFVGAFIYDLED